MIFSILLQAPLAADTVGSQINTLPVVSNASAFSMWEIIQKGGHQVFGEPSQYDKFMDKYITWLEMRN